MSEFNVRKDYTLENDFVLLRPLALQDYDHLLTFSLNEPEIWKYSLLQGGGEENLRNYLQIAVTAREEGKEYPFIVFDKRQNAYAGSTRFYDIQPIHQTLQLGYTWYGKKFQGTGLNKQCKFLLLEFAFEQIGMERVEFRADNNNQRSIAAMKSIGCTVEGLLRSNNLKHDGTRRDSIVLSILRTDWEGGVRQKLMDKLAQLHL
jgi:RimJ/RimL family protein N-acetyltransferase